VGGDESELTRGSGKAHKYKCEWAGKNLLDIGRFEPSSKMCGSCGAVNKELKLSDRVWTCSCGAKHDRDVNAAENIRRMAFHATIVA
jgi:putative transposase